MLERPWRALCVGICALAGTLLIACVGVWALIVQPQPDTPQGTVTAPEDLHVARQLIDREGWRQVLRGTPLRLSLTQRQANAIVSNVSARLAHARASIQLRQDTAELALSVPIGQTPLRAFASPSSWLNVHLEWQTSKWGAPTLTRLQLGKLNLPQPVARGLVWLAASAYDAEQLAILGLSTVQQTQIQADRVAVTLRWHPDLSAQAAKLLFPADMSAAVSRAHRVLAAALSQQGKGGDRHTATGALPLGELMGSLMAQAQQRTIQLALTSSHAPLHGEAARDNRAMLLVLGLYVNRVPLDALLPSAKGWAPLPARSLTLHGREDWAQHYLTSATLATDFGSRITDLIGMYKELLDATPHGGGSGFSFNDLAADKAGIRLGRLAMQNPMAWQSRMSRLQTDSDLLPDISDLPEFITQAQLQQRYGGPGAPAFQAVMSEIERRIAQTPALL